jgi:hypothetical protein
MAHIIANFNKNSAIIILYYGSELILYSQVYRVRCGKAKICETYLFKQYDKGILKAEHNR